MARVRVEDIVDHFGTEFRSALERAVTEVVPNANVDRYALFRAFKRAVRRKFSTWERVPDTYVEVD